MHKLFCVINCSCHARLEEIKQVNDFLFLNGWSITDNPQKADITLFYTCAFSKSLVHQMIHKIAEIKKDLKLGSMLIVGGCLPKIDRESLNKVFEGKTISPTDFNALNDIAGIKIKTNEVPMVGVIGSHSIKNFRSKLLPLERFMKKNILAIRYEGLIVTAKNLFFEIKKLITTYFVRNIHIAKGCSRNCSYCAIKFAIGTLKSKSPTEIMRQVKKALNFGYKRFNLYADCCGDYGLDIGTDFGDLLTRFLSIRKKFTLGIYYIHPTMFLKYFHQIEALCESNKIHFLFLSIQSANMRILKLMNRSYDIDEVKHKILKLKKYKNVRMRGSIMVGFPTETEEEFDDSLNFLKIVDHDENIIHFYTDMPNVESSQLSGKIDKTTMLRRYNKIKKSNIKYNVEEAEREFKMMP